jgi:hypothetical protein
MKLMYIFQGVIYLPADVSIPPMRVLLTLKKMDNIKALLSELVKVVGLPLENNITVCEVLENHISKVLEPGHQLRFLNGELRTIYAIEMLPPPESCVTPPRLSPIPVRKFLIAFENQVFKFDNDSSVFGTTFLR